MDSDVLKLTLLFTWQKALEGFKLCEVYNIQKMHKLGFIIAVNCGCFVPFAAPSAVENVSQCRGISDSALA